MVSKSKKKVTKKATKKAPVKKKAAKTIKNAKGKDIPAPKKLGRPTVYCETFCDVVVEYMGKGFSKEAVAGVIGISKETLYRWAREHTTFSDAISIGESKSRVWWERQLVDNVVHSKNGSQINGQVFNLNMKNRFGWKDKNEVSVDEGTKKAFGFSLDVNPDEVGE